MSPQQAGDDQALCFWQGSNGRINTPYDMPCARQGGSAAVSCCQRGDICLSDGICQSKLSLTPGSGFYPSRCTVAGSTGCDMHCATQDFPNLLWDATVNLWHCCNTNETSSTCIASGPSRTFKAPGPDNLTAYHIAGTTFGGLSGPGPSTQTHPSGLSKGAKAGIGIGVTFGSCILLGGLGYFLWRRKRQSRQDAAAARAREEAQNNEANKEATTAACAA